VKAVNAMGMMTAVTVGMRAKSYALAIEIPMSVAVNHLALMSPAHAFHQNGFVMMMVSGIAPMVLTRPTAVCP